MGVAATLDPVGVCEPCVPVTANSFAWRHYFASESMGPSELPC